MFVDRRRHLQSQIPADHAWLLSKPTDITYYTGFEFLVPEEEREALLFLTSEMAYLLHASFSPLPTQAPIPEAAAQETDTLQYLPRVSTVAIKQHLEHIILPRSPFQTVAIDHQHLLVSEYVALQEQKLSLEKLNRDIIWKQRMFKDDAELEHIRAAGRIAADVWNQLQSQLQTGMTELDIRDLVEALLRQAGSSRPAFPTIVAIGEHSCAPHHQPTDRQLKSEEPILIDFGATVNQYRSDMTRTIWFGKHPSSKFKAVEQAVVEAYDVGLRLVRSGMKTAGEVDTAVREHLNTYQLAEYFIHTTGHGVGLDIHELPTIHSTQQTKLSPEMVITIEPAAYLPGEFGYRHENTIILQQNAAEEVTRVA